jgi:hypothetical protein
VQNPPFGLLLLASIFERRCPEMDGISHSHSIESDQAIPNFDRVKIIRSESAKTTFFDGFSPFVYHRLIFARRRLFFVCASTNSIAFRFHNI